MASMLDEHSDYESEEIIRLDIDLRIGHGTIGLFTVDLTPNPSVTMGHIRCKLGAALGLSQEDLTIKNDKVTVPDSSIAKNYLDENKELNNGNLLSLDISKNKQKEVAINLQMRIKEDKDIKDMGRSFIIEEMSDDKDISLTIYKPCFYLFVNKYL